MNYLVNKIENLKNSEIGFTITERLNEFKHIHKRSSIDWFKELSFCILTANYRAERCILIQRELDNEFLFLSPQKLAQRLRHFGYRFPNTRAHFIIKARKHLLHLKETIHSFSNTFGARDWLVKNILGFGYKEASHFLRNIGYTDIAIIDRHISNILVKHNVIDGPTYVTKKRYFCIEKQMKILADLLSINLAELDLYLWYLKTGKILK